jgi:WXG100 family type VII secretion target
MTRLRIDTDLVEELAGRVSTEHANIGDVLKRLRSINTELAGAWDGPAQDQFEATYGNWITQLENYSTTLQNVRQYLGSVAENFRELDEAAKQAATGTTAPQ